MPYPFDPDWAGPDIFVEHKGVIVYHRYNGDGMGPDVPRCAQVAGDSAWA